MGDFTVEFYLENFNSSACQKLELGIELDRLNCGSVQWFRRPVVEIKSWNRKNLPSPIKKTPLERKREESEENDAKPKSGLQRSLQTKRNVVNYPNKY